MLAPARWRLPDPPQDVYTRSLKHAATAGLPRIRLHDVRHGHASAALTLDTYSHVLPPAADEAIAHTLATMILGRD